MTDKAGSMGSKRREPSLTFGKSDLRVSPEDRVGGGKTRPKGERLEPRLGSGDGDGLVAMRDQGDEGASMGRSAKKGGKNRNRSRDEENSGRGDDDRGRKPSRRRRSIFGWLFYWGGVAAVWGVIALGGVIAYHAAQLPPIDKLAVPKRPPNIAILGDDGTLLANRGDTGGAAIHLRQLPPYVTKAFISIEDRRFYHHWGIDPIGVTRAIVRNLSGSGGMQGGSTLTQQLAKNLFLTQERTMSRKIQEAILAIWLEHKYSKDQILELYLNRVYFGSGAYGIEAAARKYFGHGASQITLPEAAVLAGLMKAPTKLAPNRNPEAANERAAQVITAMAQEGHIPERMAKLALSRPAAVTRDNAGSINYAADYVMDVLDETVGAIDEDIVVTTTLSATKQAAGERALAEQLDKSGARYGVTQGALVAIDPGGQIRALVGGRSYSDSQFNRAVAARRQPGSAFKPFVYLTALERGLRPDTIRDDAPINVKGWQPANSSLDYSGPVTLTRALATSLNTVAVRLGLEVGPKNVAATARRLGITSDLQANASIALGTSEVTPLELVTAYAPFANGGIRVQPHVITRVRTADGKQLYQRKGASFGRIVEPEHVAMMNAMLQETLTTGTARRAELPGWQAAGKTGTSQDYRDAWFIGYTSTLVTGVWLGNDDNSPTRKNSGSNLPVAVWSSFMREALKGTQPASLPSGMWRNPSQAPPPPLPPNDIGTPMASAPGQPMRINGNGSYVQQTRATRPDPIGALIPPAQIPANQRRSVPEPVREPTLLDRLFGG
jgi:penicillin-binding protein 1A